LFWGASEQGGSFGKGVKLIQNASNSILGGMGARRMFWAPGESANYLVESILLGWACRAAFGCLEFFVLIVG
jgi:hypothetical protein